ncbi:hypothetical protein DFH28DRAFT_1118676 [Melampsora americana]|nr:hypothetical protein DFH28DRAFT_1118676 [Melampsora americana]
MFEDNSLAFLNTNSFSHFSEPDSMRTVGFAHPSSSSSESEEVNKRRKKPINQDAMERRKLKNRAAQKAFRDRKDRYVRDIEGQLTCNKTQLQLLYDDNQFLKEKCRMLLENYQVIEKKLENATNRLIEVQSDNSLPNIPSHHLDLSTYWTPETQEGSVSSESLATCSTSPQFSESNYVAGWPTEALTFSSTSLPNSMIYQQA